ncbi:MAG: hypothetical protein Q8N63_05500 [Nanoarchaeota archaeon]|nr:hypothetical protein [Nanoarchaeota archaeon]
METQNKQSLQESIRENPKEKFSLRRLLSNEPKERIPGYNGEAGEWLPIIGLGKTLYRMATKQRNVINSTYWDYDAVYQGICLTATIGGIVSIYTH